MERKSKKMKKWRMMLCGFGMAVVLAACGSDEEDIQIVEQEEIADVSQDAFQDTSQAEDEKTAEPERAEASEGEEAPEGTGESPESEQGAVFEGKAAVVNIETEDQEYKEGETVVMTTSSDRVTVVIEGNEEAAGSIMEEFERREKTFEENAIETLEWAKESPIVDDSMCYSLEQGYTVTRNDGRILAFSTMSSGYEGGAHGYYMEYGVNFDMRTGKLLSIADIAEDEAAFQEICVQEMMRQYEELEEQGILFDREMLVPGLEGILEGKMEGSEWYFTEDGIRFISNIYEIAPYAVGKITFDVPYEMVEGALKEVYKK